MIELVNSFEKKEKVEGQNILLMKKGNKIEGNVENWNSQYNIEEFPKYLTINIKRFKKTLIEDSEGNITGITTEKINNNVSDFEEINIKENKYKLVSVIIHRGSLNSGHYYAYRFLNEKIYCLNDNLINSFNSIDETNTRYNISVKNDIENHGYTFLYNK
jgi:ubiquitin C-terminal hydrolase